MKDINQIIIKCIELYSNNINKLYKNINKNNKNNKDNNNFILDFLIKNYNLKNYEKKYINNQNINKIIYKYITDKKYTYCFVFKRKKNYITFLLKFIYKNNWFNIFTIKTYILKNDNENIEMVKVNEIYNLYIKPINKNLINIQIQMAENLCKIINLNLILIKN